MTTSYKQGSDRQKKGFGWLAQETRQCSKVSGFGLVRYEAHRSASSVATVWVGSASR